MKKIFNSKMLRVFLLTTVISIGSIHQSQAFVWFGSEEKSLGSQYAYNDICVNIVEVNTYFFGILVKSEIQQRPFRCQGGGGNPQ
ncbi:MAG: hypothetical protein U5N85_01440 [Arcicella sp.]|nr:hypothetical protein [Arcicella sp.]